MVNDNIYTRPYAALYLADAGRFTRLIARRPTPRLALPLPPFAGCGGALVSCLTRLPPCCCCLPRAVPPLPYPPYRFCGYAFDRVDPAPSAPVPLDFPGCCYVLVGALLPLRCLTRLAPSR